MKIRMQTGALLNHLIFRITFSRYQTIKRLHLWSPKIQLKLKKIRPRKILRSSQVRERAMINRWWWKLRAPGKTRIHPKVFRGAAASNILTRTQAIEVRIQAVVLIRITQAAESKTQAVAWVAVGNQKSKCQQRNIAKKNTRREVMTMSRTIKLMVAPLSSKKRPSISKFPMLITRHLKSPILRIRGMSQILALNIDNLRQTISIWASQGSG